ncbi:uncharacterized protein BcabD6B2_18460 [Babesia caballi]|uniref:Uncharacterized protein n=1 Tax=Babesia caballi TaxID=5871 RepID=A0AAV4LTK4_BABCB|nr:hypothetical protein BcabD6B2_18460 [Babesia caballi]
MYNTWYNGSKTATGATNIVRGDCDALTGNIISGMCVDQLPVYANAVNVGIAAAQNEVARAGAGMTAQMAMMRFSYCDGHRMMMHSIGKQYAQAGHGVYGMQRYVNGGLNGAGQHPCMIGGGMAPPQRMGAGAVPAPAPGGASLNPHFNRPGYGAVLRAVPKQEGCENRSGLQTGAQRPQEEVDYNTAIPTANHIKTTGRQQKQSSDVANNERVDWGTEMTDAREAEEEPEYPHLALDLSRITQAYRRPQPKPKQLEPQPAPQTKESTVELRVAVGKPRYPYTAQFNDPVEKELERWHNGRTSTIKWTRIKRGVYMADNQEINLVKLNGSLYVKGAKANNRMEHVPIGKFVQRLQKTTSG